MRFIKGFYLLLIFSMLGCSRSAISEVQNGVSKVLAESRKAHIDNVSYEISLSVPGSINDSIFGKERINFDYKGEREVLQVDFAANSKQVRRVTCNGKVIEAELVNEHIIIPAKYLKAQQNILEVEFVAGDKPLNRNSEYLYSLFVPDKARYVFPCFDQPDLKATYKLTLEIPNDWIAVGNAPVQSVKHHGNRQIVKFGQSDLISTYQFAFVTGRFHRIDKVLDGKKYSIYHREKDEQKILENSDSIFKEAHHAVRWMESYTGIKQPFQKYDLVILPSFQFSGMEHVGAIYYLDSKMWLNKNATLQERIARTELIGHETAHLWFGDLVTMKWFDDVWMKEVFAGFFADKIVESSYPNVNHQLQFLISHAPKAYSEDRTPGSNSIRQNLDNLNDAGSLYGNIVYHKSPIVIRSLEKLMGEEKFRISLQEYLAKYKFSNATWLDLVKIFGSHSDFNMDDWSKTWIEGARMPVYSFNYELVDGAVSQFYVKQTCEACKGINFYQQLRFMAISDTPKEDTLLLKGLNGEIASFKGLKNVHAFIPNSDGVGYGAFIYDNASRSWLLKNIWNITDPLLRGTALINLYENMMLGKVEGDEMEDLLCQLITKERNEQLIGLELDYLTSTTLYYATEDWNYQILENSLWFAFANSADKKVKVQIIRTLSKLMRTPQLSKRVLHLWESELAKENSWISLNDLQNIAFELAIRFPEDADTIVSKVRKQIKNADALSRFNFIAQAVNPNQTARDRFFESLLKVKNRNNEPWVVDALRYLNHPLREAASEKYIKRGLEILPEIQRTGDIFFPKNWLTSLFYGHKSKEAYSIVLDYSSSNSQKLSPSLMLKLLQATDNLRRVNTQDNKEVDLDR